MAKINGRVLTVAAIIALVLVLFFVPRLMKKKTSSYDILGENLNLFNMRGSTNQVNTGDHPINTMNNLSMDSVRGNISTDVPLNNTATSLLPREIPSAEDFGTFSPDVIINGQNYLDPRAQIGYPETLGGVIRNANYDVRSEPPNPRVPVSIFNNSTITPDLMRPQFEIGR